jgi:ABC-type antimicrobial peptide transport system permease subunit
VDAWLEHNAPAAGASVLTYHGHLTRYRQDMLMVFLLFAVPEGVIAVVAAIALSILSYTFFGQRRDEFGTLNALGHSRRWLIRRTLGETATVVAAGWLVGAALCGACLAFMQYGLYSPKGLSLNFANPVVWLLTLPMPLAVIGAGTGLVSRMLSRLDPVSVIERR